MASVGGTLSYWILTLVFLVLTVALLIFKSEWFWVPLPFLLTYLVKALDWIDAD